MGWTIEATLKHARLIARHLNTCDAEYVALAVLLELGVPTKRSGFYQLLNAIVQFCEDPTKLLSKDIYPVIAQRYSLEDYNQVEQAIRNVIEAAWKKRDEEVWALYIRAGKRGMVRKPSNAEFISRIGWFVKLCQGCSKEVDYAKE